MSTKDTKKRDRTPPPGVRSPRGGAEERPGIRPAAAAGATALLTLVIYATSLPPTVLGWDDGEFAAAIRVLGITHPTGYPLYMLLAKPFDLIPWANAAVRLSMFSALCGAGAAATIAWSAARLTASVPAGLLAGAIAALNRPLWSQASRVEVYPLSALFIALAIAVFVDWSLRRRPRHVVWLALLVGLGLAHHRTAIFFTGPLLLIVLVAERPRLKLLLQSAAVAAAPLLLYLYLPIRAAADPPVMWRDTDTWGVFVHHISGAEYYYHVFARPLPEVWPVAREVAGDFVSQLTPGGIVLAAVGLVSLLVRQRLLAISLLACCAVISVWNLGYNVKDYIVFFIPAALAVSLWAGEGLMAIGRTVDGTLGARASWAGPAVTALVLVAVPISLLQTNWSRATHRGEWFYRDALSAVFAHMEPNAVYVNDGHNPVALYAQFVEGERTDIDIVAPRGELASTIRDARIRDLVPDLAAEHVWVRDVQDPASMQEGCLHFAAALGEALQWTRPIYCGAKLLTPPTDVPAKALWWNLYRLQSEPVDLLVAAPQDEPVTEFRDGIALLGVHLTPAGALPGEPVRVTLDWRCRQEIRHSAFVQISLAPVESPHSLLPQGQMLLNYGTWLAHGVRPLPPTASGFAYRQEVLILVPTNAQPGEWRLRLGVSSEKGDPIELHEVVGLQVVQRDAQRSNSAGPGAPDSRGRMPP